MLGFDCGWELEQRLQRWGAGREREQLALEREHEHWRAGRL